MRIKVEINGVWKEVTFSQLDDLRKQETRASDLEYKMWLDHQAEAKVNVKGHEGLG